METGKWELALVLLVDEVLERLSGTRWMLSVLRSCNYRVYLLLDVLNSL